jgi:hypothetical protein
VDHSNRLEEELSASEIADICQGKGIELPGVRTIINSDQLVMFAGRLMGRLFSDSDQCAIDRYDIKRISRPFYNSDYKKTVTKHFYMVERRA